MAHRRSRGIFLLGILCCLFSAADFAFTQTPQPPAAPTASPLLPNRIWNLENADIHTVIDEVSKQTGKTFIVDPRVQGKVSLISTTALTPDELYTVFLKILQTHGYTAIPSGNAIRIIPDGTAKTAEIPTVNSNEQATRGFVTQIIPVQNTPVDQLIPVLRPLLPSSGEITAYPKDNAIIISAEADKIKEIQKIISRLDQSNASDIEIVPVRYSDANEVVNSLRTIISEGGNLKSPVNIAADRNSNSILLSGPKNERDRIRNLILKMDSLAKTSTLSNTTAVVNLRYLNAKDFAAVLQKMVASGAQLQTTDAASASANNLINPSKINNNSENSSVNTSTIQIQAETEANAIIMNGPPAQIRALKKVIALLDTKPQQVLVEAIIVEVSESTMKQLGIQWGEPAPNTTTINPITGVTTTPDPFSALQGGLGIGIVNDGKLKLIINALQTDTATNILSTPSVVVLNNQKATIKIGQKISFVTGSYANSTGTAGTVSPFTTTDRQDVALHLDVTPQISGDGSVRLGIDQGDETLSGGANATVNGNPTTNESSIKTSVLMQSRQILVVGGLISNDYEDSTTQIPILGDIPVLGKLFQNRAPSQTKKNLLVFIRPIIMNDKTISDQQTFTKYDFMRALELKRKQEEDIITDKDANQVMARWPATPPLPKPFE